MSDASTRALADRLRDVLTVFERDGELALMPLAELYADDLIFRDPLQRLDGREAFVAMNRRVIRRAKRVAFVVTDAVAGERSLFLAWVMTFVPRRGPPIVFEGSTHARVRDGLIVEQREYWDLLSSVAGSLPVVGGAYARLARRLG